MMRGIEFGSLPGYLNRRAGQALTFEALSKHATAEDEVEYLPYSAPNLWNARSASVRDEPASGTECVTTSQKRKRDGQSWN